MHTYGSHIFHTSNERVREYVDRFTAFDDDRHHVWTAHGGRVDPMPISSGGTSIQGYTAKQWRTDPRLLPERIITRLPVRSTFDTRSSSDTHEGIPADGYAAMLTRLADVPGVRVCLGTEWFGVRDQEPAGVPVVHTGPIDRWFDHRAGRLGRRTLDLHTELLEVDDVQGTTVMHDADEDVPHTRVHEFEHSHPERATVPGRTVLRTEDSRWADQHDEPYYPVDTPEGRRSLAAYREPAAAEPDVSGGGSAHTSTSIASALTSYDNTIGPRLAARRAA